MNRYESAYRDYTYRGEGSPPERPQRRSHPGRAMRNSSSQSSSSSSPPSNISPRGRYNRGYATDEESYNQRRMSPQHPHSDRSGDRSNPEFTIANHAVQTIPYPRSPSLGSASVSDGGRQMDMRQYGNRPLSEMDQVQEIYIPQPEFNHRRPGSELSQGSYRTYRSAPYSDGATLRSKKSKKGGIVIETMRAPHPLCPNTRSCCCLLLLFNLGLLLICLGFVIVLQLTDPPFVWYLGVFMLVFGFATMIIGFIFCAWMCREGSPDAPLPPHSELYWTHHWRKTIHLPEMHGKPHETTIKEPIEEIRYPDEQESYTDPRYHNNSRY